MKKVHGIFAPIATAFDASGEVDYSTFAENTVAFGATKLSGLVVLGSNGEFTLLSHEEKVKLVETARKPPSGGKKWSSPERDASPSGKPSSSQRNAPPWVPTWPWW